MHTHTDTHSQLQEHILTRHKAVAWTTEDRTKDGIHNTEERKRKKSESGGNKYLQRDLVGRLLQSKQLLQQDSKARGCAPAA
ncbi:hypothetical protein AMELA_G00285860 [Ameiurus melas]|uniref:Uncharacterized protein n=1 Tax=Ameiurus melas TaxID=219545 RepID=A0A7J5ZL09_AMEME|nr:hypothetical protein AMELA_G00285860 [Ameiurus melas]